MLTCSIAFLYFMILHPPIFTLTYTLFPYATLFRSVWISGQVRRVTKPIRREMKRRAAIEPVIGHVKAEHRMGRNYLKGHEGTAPTPSSPPPATTSACYRSEEHTSELQSLMRISYAVFCLTTK